MERIIFHCDLNNFYASVECKKAPSLAKKPVAVCGSSEERKGIVLAKNEIAKAYGIKTGEAIWEAKRKCHSLVIVPPDHKAYAYYSRQVRDIYERYTDLIEPFGIDECWLDMSGSAHLFGGAEKAAYAIKEEVKKEIGLTISCGVSFNKVLAKLGSDLKKPDAVTVLSRDKWRERVHPLPAEYLMGVGRKTHKRLISRGIITIGDLARADDELMRIICGKMGVTLSKWARGLDDSPVVRYEYLPKRQSIGRGVTCPRDLKTLDDVSCVLHKLSCEVAKSLRRENVAAKKIQIEVKRTDLSRNEYMMTLSRAVRTSVEIWQASLDLFSAKHDIAHVPVRALSVRACELNDDNEPYQLVLFEDTEKIKKYEALDEMMDKVNERCGSHTLDIASCRYTKVRL